jgi:hypothetical protein
MSSAYEVSKVLVSVAERQTLTPELQRLYVQAARRLTSAYERDKALARLGESVSR